MNSHGMTTPRSGVERDALPCPARRRGRRPAGRTGGRRRRQSPDDDAGVGGHGCQPSADELAQTTLDQVACHRRADGLGHDKTDHRPGGRVIGPGRQMHHEGVPSAARASAHRLLEVGSAAHAVRSGQHRRWCQAESSARPLRRRAARIARPARVRMRRRKPWVLARRRLFGWKVRLLTRVSNYIGWASHVPRDQVQAAEIELLPGHASRACGVRARQQGPSRRLQYRTSRRTGRSNARDSPERSSHARTGRTGRHPTGLSPHLPSRPLRIGHRRRGRRPVDHDVVDGCEARRPATAERRRTMPVLIVSEHP